MSHAASAPVRLLASEERYVKKAIKYLTLKSGLAVQERSEKSVASLENEIVIEFKATLDAFDPMKDEQEELFGDKPRESVVPRIKVMIRSAAKSSPLLWQNYKNLKSEFINHWQPHYTMTSGMNEDDALENVRRHVWAFRKNKNVKKSNNKKDAPEATPENWPYEIVAFKAFHTHALLAIKKKGTASGGGGGSAGGDGSGSQGSETANEKVSSVLKSRKQQRAEELIDKKKRKVETASLLNNERKLAMDVKLSQAQAAMNHAQALKDKNKLEFLKLAHEFQFEGFEMLMKDVAKTMFKVDKENKKVNDSNPKQQIPETIDVAESEDSDDDDDDL